MSSSTSIFVVRWINFLTMMMSIGVILFGIWLGIHHDDCKRSLTFPVIGLGTAMTAISLIGFIGAWKNVSLLLWTYLVMLFLVLVAIIIFTVLAFIVTNAGSGHVVAGLRYKEYHLQDYSTWFIKQLDSSDNWSRLKSCLVNSDSCNSLQRKYRTLKERREAELTPIEAGCCWPPSECGYTEVNASYYDLNNRPASANEDCRRYRNSAAVRCYDCDSCKAGVAQYMRKEWRVVAIFSVILFVILTVVYLVACCARRNVTQEYSSFKAGGRR